VIKPFIGIDGDVPADATVFLARHGSLRGLVLSEAINPFYSDIDTHAMAMSVVDEAVRRQLCAGAELERIALLDNFCWPDPVESESTPDGAYKLAQLVRACRGLYEAGRAYGTPLISGKDSMKNESTMGGVKICVPPTLLVSAIGQIEDVRNAMTLEPKAAGDRLFLLGDTRDESGGSEYFRYLGELAGEEGELGAPRPYVGNKVPRLDPAETLPLYKALEKAAREGLVNSASAPAKGGLAVALAKAVMASGLGLEVDLEGLPPEVALFSESNGRMVITTAPEDGARIAKIFRGLPCRMAGEVLAEPRLLIRIDGTIVVNIDLAAIKTAFKETLADG
jgi:phosphoribosylformylglycinamidine synthase